MSRSRRYFVGLASGYVVTFATILVGLWLTPFTLRFLDRQEFAVFTLAGDVLMWLGLMEIGLTAVLNVKAAQLSGRPDQAQLNRLASTIFFGQCVIASAMLLAGSFVALSFPNFFGLRADLHHEALIVMALMVVASALTIATQTFSALLVAHQQMHVDNTIRLGLIAIRTGLTVWLLLEGVGLVSLAIAHLVAVVITGTLAMIRVRRLLPALQVRWRYFSWALLRQTGGLGLWFSLGGLAGIMIMYLDRIVTAKMVSIEMVTTLALTGRLYFLAWSLISQITLNARPALAQLVGAHEREKALEKYRQIFRFSSGMAVLAAASIWAGNGVFVTWWVGPENYGGPLLDACLALNLIVNCWILPSRAILTASLIVKPQTLTRMLEGGLNLAFSLLLAIPFGVVGVAIATSLAGVMTSLWYLPKIVCNSFSLIFRRFVLTEIVPLMVMIALMSGLAIFSRMYLNDAPDHLTRLLAMPICGLIGAAYLWLFVFDKKMRDYTRRNLKWQPRAG